MIKPKLIKQTEKSFIYRIPAYTDLSTTLIESIKNDGKRDLIFCFPKPKRIPEDGLRFEQISDKYILIIIYSAYPSELKQLGKFSGKPKVRLVVPATPKEFEKFDRDVYARYFKKPFRKYLSPRYLEEDKKYYSDLLPASNTILIMKGDKRVGLYSLLKVKRNGRFCKVVPFSFISHDLTKAERLDAHFQITNWIKNNAAGLEVSGGVHAANVRAQRFAIKFGLKPVRVVVETRVN